MHLREAETKKRPSTDFMETIQKDVNPSMRAILIDWLVKVAEEYRLAPDTLYLIVNYIDCYLSGNEINRQRLQLLGVACMLIAAAYDKVFLEVLFCSATALWTCTDVAHVLLQFSLAWCGKLIRYARAVAAHYVRFVKGLCFDLFIIRGGNRAFNACWRCAM
ncbi:Cyclin-A1-1 [Zea mays]|uniref:Cyclin-A1-1 n=1 Tax=Zea mays TaxID=4577 RepID=A0A1D6LMZ7_MAIZE|nr:Cyclin-A1-1 [Zea mays]